MKKTNTHIKAHIDIKQKWTQTGNVHDIDLKQSDLTHTQLYKDNPI